MGKFFDTRGFRVLAVVPLLSCLSAPLAFSTSSALGRVRRRMIHRRRRDGDPLRRLDSGTDRVLGRIRGREPMNGDGAYRTARQGRIVIFSCARGPLNARL